MNHTTLHRLGSAFFMGLGLASAYMAMRIFAAEGTEFGTRMLLVHHSNPILRYIIAYLFLFFCIPAFGIPLLSRMGVLVPPQRDLARYTKAKNNVIIGTLSAPAAVVLAVIFLAEGRGSGLNVELAILAAVVLGGSYLHSIVVWLKCRG